MPTNLQQLAAADPDNISETICDGPFYVSASGPFATLTFTHVRPDAAAMFANIAAIPATPIVRARIVLTLDNLAELRTLLNKVLQSPGTTSPAAGGRTAH